MSRVLVFPGDLLDQDFGAACLDQRQVTVRTAASVDEALDIAPTWRPEIIVFSSNLPGKINAIEFCRRIRAHATLNSVHLVMLTDFVGHSLGPVYEAEADAHLVTPVSPAQLHATMATLLTIEKRALARVPVQVLARLEGLAQDEQQHPTTIANTINLSEMGMRIESKEHLAMGQRGEAHFYLPGSPDRLSVPCTVRLLLDEVLLHYAIDFEGIDSQSRQAIAVFVEQELSG